MTLAYLAARRQSKKVESATFFTAQVDFEDAGDLKIFVDDDQLALVSSLSEGRGYLDGRYMAATFNLLHGQDLIWNYVVNNYLLGKERSEEHTYELQSLMRISYAVFCLKKKKTINHITN